MFSANAQVGEPRLPPCSAQGQEAENPGWAAARPRAFWNFLSAFGRCELLIKTEFMQKLARIENILVRCAAEMGIAAQLTLSKSVQSTFFD